MCRFFLSTSGKYSESIRGEFPRLRFSVCMNRPGLQVAEASGKRRPRKGCLCFRKPPRLFQSKTEKPWEKRAEMLLSIRAGALLVYWGRIMNYACQTDWMVV